MSKDSIQVGIKMRPLLTREKGSQIVWRIAENTITPTQASGETTYCFDHVFDQSVRNQLIFDKMAKHIVHSAVKGFNGTIFAYGQTSSGKTYTMMGDDNDPGVMVLAAKEIFEEIEKTSDTRQFLLRVGFIEIYNEKIFDLLNKSNLDLKIYESSNGNVNVNCHEICITSEEQLLNILETGNKERTVGETNMNERSSRSHSILRLTIESRDVTQGEDGEVSQGLLHLVDLAGSERADQTGASGARLKEGGHINKSLLFLGQVIKRLAENGEAGYINYRDSKLTRILQASLGGNAFTSIICTVTPTAVEETQSTLNFATSAKTIKNKPRVNEIVSDAAAMKRLEREVKELKRELEEEKKKSASQIKLSRIENLLSVKQHSLINSSSLHRSRHRKDNRRRTWCPDVGNTTVASILSPVLPAPNVFATPYITIRECKPTLEKQYAVCEDFQPAEQFDFNQTPQLSTPPSTFTITKSIDSASPITPNKSAYIRLVEEELRQLQEFTNLENKVGVDHDVYASLKQSIESVYKRNEELEKEHRDYLFTKHELAEITDEFTKSEKRCDDLEVQISKLKVSDKKLKENEAKISQLQKTIENLEIENRNAVELQFEFDRHQNKAKLRENDLLRALQEKDDEIAKLEKQLKILQDERTAELLQLSHCVVGNGIAAGGGPKDAMAATAPTTTTLVNSNCQKCENLQRVLEENKAVKLEFESLKQLYGKLQSNYEKSMQQAQSTQQQLSEQLSAPLKECEELRVSVVELRVQLEEVKKSYDDVHWELGEKTERCTALNRELELAQQKYFCLETKYADLDANLQRQEDELANIRADYASLEHKFNELQGAYDRLKSCETKCAHDCQRLQHENDALQKEIQQLKTRIEQMIKYCDTKHSSQAKDEQIAELQQKCDQFQQENEQLSMEIMDRVEESDALLKKYKKLETDFEKLQKEMMLLEQTRTAERIDSTASCGNDATILKTCANLEAKLFDAETQQKQWLAEKSAFESKIENLEMKITESTEGMNKLQSIIDGLRAQNLSLLETSEQTITHLREEVLLLSQQLLEKSTILESCLGNCSCVESQYKIDLANLSQFKELLQERIMSSQCELSVNGINGSIVKLESFETLSKPITAIKERTFEASEWQTKVNIKVEESNSPTKNCSSDLASVSNRRASVGNKTLCPQEIDVTALSQSTISVEGDLQNFQRIKTLQIELKRKEEECADLQLMLLEKLNQAENGFRENLRAYNDEWEQHRLQYEAKISELEEALSQTVRNNVAQNQNDLSLSSSFMHQDYQQHQRQNNCSTPTTTPTTTDALDVSSSSKKQKIRTQRSKIIAECTEQIVELSQNVKDLKAANSQLSVALSEKTKQLDEQTRKSAIGLEAYECALTRMMIECEICKLETIIDYQAEHTRNMKIQMLNRSNESLLKTGDGNGSKTQKENEIFNLLTKIKACANRRNLQIQELEKIDEKLLSERNSINVDAALLAKIKENLEPATKECFNLKKNIDDLAAEIDGKIAELEALCESFKREQSKKQVDKKDARCVFMEKQKNQLKQQNEALLKELRTFKLESDDCLTKVTNESEAFKKELEESRLSNDQLAIKIKELCDNEAAVKAISESLKNELSIKRTTEQTLQHNLTELQAKFQVEQQKYKREQTELQSKIEEMQLKCEELIAKNAEFETSNDELNQKCHELTETSNAQLQELQERGLQIKDLQDQNKTLQALENAATAKLLENEKILHQRIEAYNSVNQQLLTLQHEFTELQAEYQAEQQKHKRDKAEQESKIKEMQFKCDELKAKNSDLEKTSDDLKQKIVDLTKATETEQGDKTELEKKIKAIQLKCQELIAKNAHFEASNNDLRQKIADFADADSSVRSQQRTEIKKLESENKRLTSRLQALEVVTSERKIEHEKQLQQRIEAYNKLNQLLNSKTVDFKEKLTQLEITNTFLRDQNKQYSERTEALNELIRAQTAATLSSTDSANNTLELSTSSNASRKNSPAGKSIIGHEDIGATVQRERKNRRLSQHDENRRQSARFTPILSDASTLTDPVDATCECIQLRTKIQEMERELFIRKSQVTALTLELRNNPLKLENANLIKRIQEEQKQYNTMYTKYKGRIEDQNTKIRSLEEQAVKLKALEEKAKLAATAVPSFVQCNDVETQTESDIQAVIDKMASKYRDLKNIARFRGCEIHKMEKKCEELVEKLHEKENVYKRNPMCPNGTAQASTLTESSSTRNKAFDRFREALKEEPK